MENLAAQLRKERESSLKEKYSNYLEDICNDIRKKGVSEFMCPNDCDATANNLSEFLKNKGFSVTRIMWKPWHPGSYTKMLVIRV